MRGDPKEICLQTLVGFEFFFFFPKCIDIFNRKRVFSQNDLSLIDLKLPKRSISSLVSFKSSRTILKQVKTFNCQDWTNRFSGWWKNGYEDLHIQQETFWTCSEVVFAKGFTNGFGDELFYFKHHWTFNFTHTRK